MNSSSFKSEHEILALSSGNGILSNFIMYYMIFKKINMK